MAAFIRHHPLRKEMHPFDQSGVLQDVDQQHFPEISLYFGVPGQSVRQVTGLVPYRLGLPQNLFDVCPDGRALGGGFLLGFLDGLVEFGEFFPDRFQQFRDGVRALAPKRRAVLCGKSLESILHALQILCMLFLLCLKGCFPGSLHLRLEGLPGSQRAFQRSLLFGQRKNLRLQFILRIFVGANQFPSMGSSQNKRGEQACEKNRCKDNRYDGDRVHVEVI